MISPSEGLDEPVRTFSNMGLEPVVRETSSKRQFSIYLEGNTKELYRFLGFMSKGYSARLHDHIKYLDE